MRIINSRDIMETIEMLTAENLDVRTVTMGISRWTASTRMRTRRARKSTTRSPVWRAIWSPSWTASAPNTAFPSSTSASASRPLRCCWAPRPTPTPCSTPKRWDRAAKAVGVNFIGGFGALVHKGFSAGDKRLIAAIPRATGRDRYCLLQRQYRLDEIGHQHGRRQADGRGRAPRPPS